ncbi:MAG TPA: HNH endonuclease [Spirochaetota bacterium]|nr:HNH endonuclease [Spirochaetota bacterium]HNT09954.1 HNH endonuclease [Spirochaetota bacterium]HNV45714.1 HNH endonuclease [Spirochaetota bacterium]HOS38397.1 HNH endonuclease [Spirochaetota bacterium]HPU87780.1 HNH endonuclease [Spirochaetota bacterium]
MLNSDVLVLNSGFIPIRITSVRDAVCLIAAHRAVPVIEDDEYVRSPSISIRIPSVISVLGYNSFPQRRVVFSKLNVIYRDDMLCQYCGSRFNMKDLTVDHVIPRSRWESVTGRDQGDGFSTWHNLVCACRWCNNRKGSRLLHELGWALLREPFEPEYMPYIFVSFERAKQKGWLPFCNFNVRIIGVVE